MSKAFWKTTIGRGLLLTAFAGLFAVLPSTGQAAGPAVGSKLSFTVNGRAYNSVTVTRMDAAGFSFTTSDGLGHVNYADLPADLQKKLGWAPAQAPAPAATPPRPVPPAAKVAAATPAPPPVSHLNAEAVALFTFCNDFCTLGGQKREQNHDMSGLPALASSQDETVRQAAALVQKALAQGEIIQKKQNEMSTWAAQRAPNMMAGVIGGALLGLGKPPDLGRDLDAAKQAMGGEESMAARQKMETDMYQATYEMHTARGEIRDKLAELAHRNAAPALPLFSAQWVDGGAGGLVEITQRSARTLHNCLLITRTVCDPKKVEQAFGGEQVLAGLSGFLMGGGVGKETNNTFALRVNTAKVNTGRSVFLPEWPRGQAVRLLAEEPRRLPWATRTEVSVWSDEGSVEGATLAPPPAASVVKSSAATAARDPFARKTTGLGAAAAGSTNPLDQPARPAR